MLVTTQWPLKRAATSPHLSGFVFYGCLESLTELSALCIFPAIAKMKGEAYAPNIYHYLLMTWLACDQLLAYFLCHNYVSVFYHKSRFYSWQIQRFSKSGGWLTHLRQHKTSIFSSLCQCHETQLQLECLRSEDTLYLWGLPILPIRIGSQVKTRCQSYKFKEFAKSSFFSI